MRWSNYRRRVAGRREKAALGSRKLLGERGSDSRISEAPPHNAAVSVVPSVSALRPNAVASLRPASILERPGTFVCPKCRHIETAVGKIA